MKIIVLYRALKGLSSDTKIYTIIRSIDSRRKNKSGVTKYYYTIKGLARRIFRTILP